MAPWTSWSLDDSPITKWKECGVCSFDVIMTIRAVNGKMPVTTERSEIFQHETGETDGRCCLNSSLVESSRRSERPSETSVIVKIASAAAPERLVKVEGKNAANPHEIQKHRLIRPAGTLPAGRFIFHYHELKLGGAQSRAAAPPQREEPAQASGSMPLNTSFGRPFSHVPPGRDPQTTNKHTNKHCS